MVFDRAILHSRRTVIEALFGAGADVDIPDSSGQTCLHIACKVGDSEIAKMVLDKSRNVTAKDIRCGI